MHKHIQIIRTKTPSNYEALTNADSKRLKKCVRSLKKYFKDLSMDIKYIIVYILFKQNFVK